MAPAETKTTARRTTRHDLAVEVLEMREKQRTAQFEADKQKLIDSVRRKK